jgi:hypothetical protein
MHSEEYMTSSWPVRDRTYSVKWRPQYFERIAPATWASTRKSCELLYVHFFQHYTPFISLQLTEEDWNHNAELREAISLKVNAPVCDRR